MYKEKSDRSLAKDLWEYNLLNHTIKPVDFIFVMCSYNLSVAHHAYELFIEGISDRIVLSGGMAHQNDLLNTGWNKEEAIIFQDYLLKQGMPADKLIIEAKAKNCGENVTFSKQLLDKKEIFPRTGIVVQKPYMERRAYATVMKQWPDIIWAVASPNIKYEEYIKEYNENNLINIIVGDTYRIIDYAQKGYQIEQPMPNSIKKSLNELRNRGYNKHIN